MSVKVVIVNGDIVAVKSDALITAINSGGIWAGGIDGVILRNAGDQFHRQAAQAMPLSHGQVVFAKQRQPHNGNFTAVIFVVDDLVGQLRDIVYNGLEAAHQAKLGSVTLPTIRMGVMLGVIEKTEQEAVDEMAEALAEFTAAHPDSSLQRITFVVYNNPRLEKMVRETMTHKLVA